MEGEGHEIGHLQCYESIRYKAEALGLMTSGIEKYKIHLIGAQEVTRNYTLLYGVGDNNHQLGSAIYFHRQLRSAVKKVNFISDSVTCTCIMLKGRWSDIIVLNANYR